MAVIHFEVAFVHDCILLFQAIDNCISTSGFSVGEYAALVFAGVLTFEEGI